MKRIAIILTLVMMACSVHAQDTSRVVNYGFRVGANLSQPLLRGVPINITSATDLGCEAAFLMDYNIGRHFAIRFGINYLFERSTLTDSASYAHSLRSWAIEIPVYAVVRIGNCRSGWGYIGAGPYTQFILNGNYNDPSGDFNPYHHVIDVDPTTGDETLAMTDSHSGLGAVVGYEFPFGFFFDFSYRISLSDMLAFDHNESMSVRPHKLSFGIGWRF